LFKKKDYVFLSDGNFLDLLFSGSSFVLFMWHIFRLTASPMLSDITGDRIALGPLFQFSNIVFFYEKVFIYPKTKDINIAAGYLRNAPKCLTNRLELSIIEYSSLKKKHDYLL